MESNTVNHFDTVYVCKNSCGGKMFILCNPLLLHTSVLDSQILVASGSQKLWKKSFKWIYTVNIKTDQLILAFKMNSYLCCTESKWSVSFLTLFSLIHSHWTRGEHFAWAGWSSATELFSMLPTDRCWARLLKEKKKYSGTKITRRHIKPTRLFVVSCIRAQKFCTEIINMKSTWWKIKFPSCVSFFVFESFGPLLFEPCPTLFSPLTPDLPLKPFSVFALLQIQALYRRKETRVMQ